MFILGSPRLPNFFPRTSLASSTVKELVGNKPFFSLLEFIFWDTVYFETGRFFFLCSIKEAVSSNPLSTVVSPARLTADDVKVVCSGSRTVIPYDAIVLVSSVVRGCPPVTICWDTVLFIFVFFL